MKIKKIALSSFIFIASFALHNAIMPMEESKRKIQSELHTLDRKIIDLKKDARTKAKQNNTLQQQQNNEQTPHIQTLKEEMEKKSALCNQKREIEDQTHNEYRACTKKRNKETETLYFWQSYTVDCRNLNQAWSEALEESSQAGREYSKAFQVWNKASWPTVAPGNHTAEQKYMSNVMAYNSFKNDFERCGRHNDATCFKDLEEEITEWNKK